MLLYRVPLKKDFFINSTSTWEAFMMVAAKKESAISAALGAVRLPLTMATEGKPKQCSERPDCLQKNVFT